MWWNHQEKIVLGWGAKSPNCNGEYVIDTQVVGSQGSIGKAEVTIPQLYTCAVCDPNTGKSVCFFEINTSEAKSVYYNEVSLCEEAGFNQDFFIDSGHGFEKCFHHKSEIDLDFWGLKNITETVYGDIREILRKHSIVPNIP